MTTAYLTAPPSQSRKDQVVGGIPITIYGLDEMGPDGRHVAVLYLLHPRLGDKGNMEQMAYACVDAWNSYRQLGPATGRARVLDLLVVTLDHRNHGQRLYDKMANRDWTHNPRHAADMFSIIEGTTADVAHLIRYLPLYVDMPKTRNISKNLVAGVSLGGHVAWQCLFNVRGVDSAMSVLGCPDFGSLMRWRAAHATDLPPTIPGDADLIETLIPGPLQDAMALHDPAASTMRRANDHVGPKTTTYKVLHDTDSFFERSAAEWDEMLQETPELKREWISGLHGRSMLSITSTRDPLVPHASSCKFLDWLQTTTKSGQPTFKLVTKIYDTEEHKVNPQMSDDLKIFLLRQMIDFELELCR